MRLSERAEAVLKRLCRMQEHKHNPFLARGIAQPHRWFEGRYMGDIDTDDTTQHVFTLKSFVFRLTDGHKPFISINTLLFLQKTEKGQKWPEPSPSTFLLLQKRSNQFQKVLYEPTIAKHFHSKTPWRIFPFFHFPQKLLKTFIYLLVISMTSI